MINYTDLEKVWENIKLSGKDQFEFDSFDNGCSKTPIFIGFNSKKNRCLFLELPNDINVDILNTEKENLSLFYFSDTQYIVLELTDSAYFDLFNDLILSIYQRIFELEDIQESIDTFVKMFHKWSEFFDDKSSNKLSENSIKGLWGEMFVLKNLIQNCEAKYLNNILLSWRGPYDKGHDFEFDDKSIEVKTKDINKQYVTISSEFQLDKENGKDLELLVLSVDSDYIHGTSISSLLNEIKDIVILKLGDFSIILDGLSEKNITAKNIFDYDNYRFIEINEIVYECKDDFPCLKKSTIPTSVNCINYNLNLKFLTDYIKEERFFNDAN